LLLSFALLAGKEIKLMKLLTKKKRKIAVLFTGGLGDTLLYTPLLKELKKKQFSITGVFYSKYASDSLLDDSLIDKKVYCSSKISLLTFAFTHFKTFVNTYTNHLTKGKAIALTAWLCSSKVTTTLSINTSSTIPKRNKNIIPSFTDAEQNMHLLYSVQNAAIKKISDFYLLHPALNKTLTHKFVSTGNYFILQISAGNNNTPYKNWPVNYWLKLTEMLCTAFPQNQFLVVGDDTEMEYASEFEKLSCQNCKVLIGKTSVQEIFNLIAFSNGYIGLDSGLMHLAVALQKKSVTIFGGTNEKLYGYQFLDAVNHKVIAAAISCRPCSAWKNANTSRVNNPLLCPDIACLTAITPGLVYEQVVSHFQL
jgi:ADP-heptose:LPS heptosyltransferase